MVDAKVSPEVGKGTTGSAPGVNVEETKEIDKSAILKSGDGAEAKATAAQQKAKKKDRNYFLLNAKTENYADDSTLYKARITREHRLEYWQKMIEQKKRRKPGKKDQTYQEMWMQGDYDFEGDTYPSIFLLQINIIISQVWDYLYLLMFLIYLLLVAVIYDGLASSVLPAGAIPSDLASSNATIGVGISIGELPSEAAANAAALGLSATTLLMPLVFMVLMQVIPSLGIFYFINRCNDLCKYKAKTNFGGWNYSSIMIAQAVEYFWYGGRANADGAGKCAYGSAMMSLFGRKKLELGDLDARDIVEEESDDEEEFVEEPYPEDGHLTIDQCIEKARADLVKDPDNEDLQLLVQGKEEVSFLSKIRAAKNAKAFEEAERIRFAQLENEANAKDWTEWQCMVCLKENRRPTKPISLSDVFFGEKGVFFKRWYAIIRKRKDVPCCKFCFTYVDYTPPLGSAHTFPYNKAPYKAFNKYPIVTTVQAGLDNSASSRYWSKCKSCLFGVRNNSSSKLVYNDWRLRIFLNGLFPETPRQIKRKDELFKVGEFVECKLQKSEWSRCIILKARENHTYDIRYDPGDELRLVDEGKLRMPPEKRSYAYKVELCMVFILFTFPIGVLAAVTISPAMLFFGPLIVGIFLSSTRIFKLFIYYRNHFDAGFYPLLKLTIFYTTPLLLMTLASFTAFIGSDWLSVAYFWIGAKLSSLPILYIMKPNFALFAFILFVQTGAGFYALASYVDGIPLHSLLTVNLAPLITATLTLMYYRRVLTTILDVNLVIRPPLNFIAPESLCTRMYHLLIHDPHAADKDPEERKDEAV